MKLPLMVIALLAGSLGSARAECGNEGVYVFGAYWCPACRAVERYLDRYNIEHHRFEVTDNHQVQEFMRARFGGTTIPVVVVDSDYRIGFDVTWLQGALCTR
jgi:glutaredoxin